MTALLALIPGKDLLYSGIILMLLLAGAYEIHHLKAEGAAAQVAADTKLAATVAAHNTQLQTVAAKTSASIEAQYESDLQTLTTPAPRVVCNRVAPGGDKLPQTAGGSPDPSQYTGPGVPASANGSQNTVDIGPPLTVAGHDADAQIKALQADVRLLIAEMNGAK